jgi:hypothetical protein
MVGRRNWLYKTKSYPQEILKGSNKECYSGTT